MQVKNNVVVGMLLGLILPLLAWVFSEVFFRREIIADKPGVPYLIAVAINLILLKQIYKANAEKAGIGLLIVTFTVVILTFVFKIKLH
ncbi:MAG: hypothetical protein V5804_07335 [Mucilaginibacter sp.]|uniref:hypothetical protein n=1 Tax=Mucilaginibacter sp. TaxID=1882438 RepID=UPI0034E4D9AA